MADPVRNDEPLSDLRFSETSVRPGPVPVTRTPADSAGLLPERATDKPLGEWPPETLEGIREERAGGRGTLDNLKSQGANALDTLREKARPVADFVQDRVADMRYRLRVVRGRVRSGELQEELRDRAEFYARNYPLQFIGGAAAAGFVIGFLLRMWRDE